ncbi:MAG TPA: tetratricopeptide repeat protein [Flavobacteriales bacterium]|nr:tetratricopeptide repeat protein [Flavobacteriales bacterium]
MKLILTLFLFAPLPLFSQPNGEFQKKEIDTLLAQSKQTQALPLMKAYVSKPDTSTYYARVKIRIAFIYDQVVDSVDQARKWFRAVMKDPYIDDKKQDFWLGGWEMFGNYKYVSCYSIGVSYYKEGNYDEALRYYKLALDSFPYYSTSGSDINYHKTRVINNIADLYSKKNDLTSAFAYLLPFFNDATIYSERSRNKAARIIKEHNLKKAYLDLISKDFTSLIDNKTIVMKLEDKKIILDNFKQKKLKKEEIEALAKFYWQAIRHIDIIEELSK